MVLPLMLLALIWPFVIPRLTLCSEMFICPNVSVCNGTGEPMNRTGDRPIRSPPPIIL